MNSIERFLKIDLQSLKFAAGVALAISVAAYFIFISQHLIGNHALRMPWLIGNEQIGNGRWLAPLFGHLHYDADVPVFMPVLGLILGLAAGLLASALWRVGAQRMELAVIYAVILVFPTNLAHFYYSFMAPLFFVAWLFAAAAVVAADRMSPVRIAAGAVAVLLMLASYQAALGVFAVLASTAVIARLAAPGGDERAADIKQVAMAIAARLTAGLVGGVAYYFSLGWLGVSGAQSLEVESFGDLLARIISVISWAFEHLWITQPDLLSPIKITLLMLLVLAVLITLGRVWRSPVRLALVALAWLGAVVGTKAIFLVSDPTGSVFEYRYNTSLNFLHAFSIFVVLSAVREQRRLRWGALALAGMVVVTLIQADLVRQHVLHRGQQHDLAIANRILARMESLPELNQHQTYDLIRIGHYSRFRWNLYQGGDWRIDRAGDGHMDFGEITDRWVDEDVFRLLGSSIRFQQTSTDPRFAQKYDEVIESGILDGRQPWPHPSSVFIDGDRIIVFMQRPPAPRAPVAQPATRRLLESDVLQATLEPARWRSLGGGPANILVRAEGIEFAHSQAGVSTDALRVEAGDQIRQVFVGRILEPGAPDVGLPFPIGPVILNDAGEVVSWWNSTAGAEVAATADSQGRFTAERIVTVPENAVAAHIAFHGPYMRDRSNLPGRIRIESARLERVNDNN